MGFWYYFLVFFFFLFPMRCSTFFFFLKVCTTSLAMVLVNTTSTVQAEEEINVCKKREKKKCRNSSLWNSNVVQCTTHTEEASRATRVPPRPQSSCRCVAIAMIGGWGIHCAAASEYILRNDIHSIPISLESFCNSLIRFHSTYSIHVVVVQDFLTRDFDSCSTMLCFSRHKFHVGG